MPGYNHYVDCPRGWRVNYGRLSYSDRARLVSDMRRRDAKNPEAGVGQINSGLLRQSERALSRMYCQRVFSCKRTRQPLFDHLSPPWPKHGRLVF